MEPLPLRLSIYAHRLIEMHPVWWVCWWQGCFFFFVCMGLLIDLDLFVESVTTNLVFALGLTVALMSSNTKS
jgi:hypothetical protein